MLTGNIFDRILYRIDDIGFLGFAWFATLRVLSVDRHIHADLYPYFNNVSATAVFDILTSNTHKIDGGIVALGHICGLWNVVPGLQLQCSLSNTWINNKATIAFLYMRPLCGRDVAGIIARKVAQFYKNDIEWLASLAAKDAIPLITAEPMIRQRLIDQWVKFY